jgi:hypothetical protein
MCRNEVAMPLAASGDVFFGRHICKQRKSWSA